MQKTGGFKLAVEKTRNYYFEISAVVISLLLLSLVVYSIFFITGIIAKVFSNKENIYSPDTAYNLEKAASLRKSKTLQFLPLRFRRPHPRRFFKPLRARKFRQSPD